MCLGSPLEQLHQKLQTAATFLSQVGSAAMPRGRAAARNKPAAAVQHHSCSRCRSVYHQMDSLCRPALHSCRTPTQERSCISMYYSCVDTQAAAVFLYVMPNSLSHNMPSISWHLLTPHTLAGCSLPEASGRCLQGHQPGGCWRHAPGPRKMIAALGAPAGSNKYAYQAVQAHSVAAALARGSQQLQHPLCNCYVTLGWHTPHTYKPQLSPCPASLPGAVHTAAPEPA